MLRYALYLVLTMGTFAHWCIFFSQNKTPLNIHMGV